MRKTDAIRVHEPQTGGITCHRLQLIPATVEFARADLRGRPDLERKLQVRIPESWPPALFDPPVIEYVIARMEGSPDHAGWWLHYFVRRADAQGSPVLIGVGGYKGPPDRNGNVEIGYSILPEFRRQGYATEAAQGLVTHAFKTETVIHVIAETLPQLRASIGVLENCGFSPCGEGSENGVIRYALGRSQFKAFRKTNG